MATDAARHSQVKLVRCVCASIGHPRVQTTTVARTKSGTGTQVFHKRSITCGKLICIRTYPICIVAYETKHGTIVSTISRNGICMRKVVIVIVVNLFGTPTQERN